LNRAEAEDLLILTLDKDFWQLALQSKNSLRRSGIILFRVHPAVPANLMPLIQRAFSVERHWKGHVSIVTTDVIRMVPALSTPTLAE
jgi:predicted nuclease of predicted toxin-antitoxin system